MFLASGHNASASGLRPAGRLRGQPIAGTWTGFVEAGVDAVTAAALETREVNIGDLNISTPEYRRVGHAIATLVVKAAAPDCADSALIHARMRVQRPADSI